MPPASPTSGSAQNLTISIIFAPGGAPLSPLSEICHKVPTTDQIVCFSFENINGWRNLVLQTAATATLWAWDGPESSYGSSYLHFKPIHKMVRESQARMETATQPKEQATSPMLWCFRQTHRSHCGQIMI